jgi:hypothetical protein
LVPTDPPHLLPFHGPLEVRSGHRPGCRRTWSTGTPQCIAHGQPRGPMVSWGEWHATSLRCPPSQSSLAARLTNPASSLWKDPMMAGVTGKVIALVCAALAALPVSGQHLARWHQSAHSEQSALAVAGIADGTVLALVKALRFASTLPGASGGLDQGCARRDQAAWATADGCYESGSRSVGSAYFGSTQPEFTTRSSRYRRSIRPDSCTPGPRDCLPEHSCKRHPRRDWGSPQCCCNSWPWSRCPRFGCTARRLRLHRRSKTRPSSDHRLKYHR